MCMYQKCDKKKEEVHQHPSYYCKWSVTDNITSIINAPNPAAHATAKMSSILYLLKYPLLKFLFPVW